MAKKTNLNTWLVMSVILLALTASASADITDGLRGLWEFDDAGDLTKATIGNDLILRGNSGSGSGRVYTITYQAVDDSGNVNVASATVTVPHDQR